MSKKILSMGGAALLLITFLALLGCPGAGNPIPPKPTFSIASVMLDTDALHVTFNATLAEIDKAKGPNYTTTQGSYIVSKAKVAVTNFTVAKGGDDKTVKLGLTGIHTSLGPTDKISVELKGFPAKDYIVAAPKAVSAKVVGGNIEVMFSDGLAATPAPAADQFTLAGITPPPTISAAAVAFNKLTLTTALSGTPKDLKLTYTPPAQNQWVGINGIAVEKFEQLSVTTTDAPPPVTTPLTAGLKSGAPNSATELTLEFNGELYKAGAPLPADEVVTSLFGKSGTVAITSAKVGSDKKTVIFVLSGTVDKDTIIPATSATVTSSTGEAWKGLVTFSTSAWGITTP